uniref:FAD oxidoreductase n=1 Tax=Phyllosticta cirsii TaxID=1986016 RepID=A0A1X9PXX6_9PEZI|nr:FAD oxidoreductase [Phyllosticta cirsii]
MSLFRVMVAGLALRSTVQASSLPPPRSDLCRVVDSQLPGLVGFPNSTSYQHSQSTYYTQNEREINPGCVFRPKSTDDVSRFVKIAADYDRRNRNPSLSEPLFAVRSGGHTLWGGAANAPGSVTVDMRGFDSFSLSANKQVASIGGGSNFANVYPKADAYNLTVIGGRVPGVAAGGFLSGGGKNFWSRRHGFGCDNVHGYEVVLANGKVVYASANENRDLWLALKGGSNNFGIITRFDLATYPLDRMWGGMNQLNFTPAVLDAEAAAFSNFMRPENFDDAADVGVLLGFTNGDFFILNTLFYLAPVANPPCLANFTSIAGITMRSVNLTTVGERVAEDGNIVPPSVPRSFELVYSFHNADAATYRQHMKIYQDEVSKIRSVEGLQMQYLLQPMPVTNGTNVLGVPANARDLGMWVLTGLWNKASDDKKVENALKQIVEQSERLLKRKNLLIDFKYLNYADISQDPISTYGRENIKFLWAASKKYDPTGMWQKRVPGIKLPKRY